MLLKQWWKSRTIWAGLAVTVLAGLSFFHLVPREVDDLTNFFQFWLGILTIYFRRTTKAGIIGADDKVRR